MPRRRLGVRQFRREATGRSPGRWRGVGLWERVRALEAQGAAKQGRARATRLAEAGDLLDRAGLPRAAAVRYGGAIDAYLEAGYFSNAEQMCLRLLDAAPGAVRVRATMALIFMGRGMAEQAESVLRDYVEASRATGDVHFALRRLCLMAQVVTDTALRDVILEQVERLQAEARIGMNPCSTCSHECRLAGKGAMTPGLYWERLVDVGLRGPRELADATPHWDAAAWLMPGSLASRGPAPNPAAG